MLSERGLAAYKPVAYKKIGVLCQKCLQNTVAFGNSKTLFTFATFDVIKKISFRHNFSILSKKNKNIHVICKNLFFWMARKQEFNMINLVFKKLFISLEVSLNANNMAKLVVDNAVCEELISIAGY